MTLQWKDEYRTGVAEIDEQHKKLFQALNDLKAAIQRGEGHAVVLKLLHFLEDYARQHFGHEEECMHRHRCPVSAINKKAHGEFIKKFDQIRSKVDPDDVDAYVVLKLYHELSQWLVGHICRVDTHLRACMSESAAGESAGSGRSL